MKKLILILTSLFFYVNPMQKELTLDVETEASAYIAQAIDLPFADFIYEAQVAEVQDAEFLYYEPEALHLEQPEDHKHSQLNRELLEKCATNNVTEVLNLIDQGANILSARKNLSKKLKNCNGLQIAITNYQIKTAEQLIEIYPDLIKLQDYEGSNSLHYAAKFGDTNLIELILNKNPELLESQDNDGCTALHIAADRIYPKADAIRCIEFLISKGAQVNKPDAKCFYPLHWASSVKIIEILIKNNAYINAADDTGWTALHWFSSYGHISKIKALLKHGADINAVDSIGRKPSTVAHEKTKELFKQFEVEKQKKVAKELIEKNPKVSITDIDLEEAPALIGPESNSDSDIVFLGESKINKLNKNLRSSDSDVIFLGESRKRKPEDLKNLESTKNKKARKE